MNADNDDDLQSPEPERPSSLPGIYLIFAAGIAFAAIRLFVWMLRRDGFVTEEDGNGMVLVAMPIALLVIVWLGPSAKR